jgi:hypothetical protein
MKKKWLEVDVCDVMITVGLLMVGGGLELISTALALIVTGALLLIIGLGAAWRKGA